MADLNWRKPEDYAYTQTLTLRQWAWEFLRRSRRYRMFYDAFTKQVESTYEGKRPGDEIDLGPILEFYRLGYEFGLGDHLPGPEARADKIKQLSWGWGVGLATLSDSEKEMLREHPALVTLRFNLLFPIHEQLRVAEKVLKDIRQQLDAAGVPKAAEPKVRIRTDLWTIYLRLLDARNANETIAEMGRVVYRDSGDPRKSAQNALRKAEAFAENGYRDLLLRGETEWGEGN